jgi:hypothetical protein
MGWRQGLKKGVNKGLKSWLQIKGGFVVIFWEKSWMKMGCVFPHFQL